MHQVPIEEYCRTLGADPEKGLTAAEAKLRLNRDGLNILVQRKQEPEWRNFSDNRSS